MNVSTLRQWLKRQPATLLLIVVVWVAFASRGGNEDLLRQTFGLAATGDMNFLHVFTSGLTSSRLAGCVVSTVLIAILGTASERVLGTARFLLTALGAQAVAVPLGLGLAQALGSVISSRALTDGVYLSPAGWVVGSALMASGAMSTLWRRRIRAFGGAIALTLFLVSGSVPSIVTLTACLVGWVAGDLANGRASVMVSRPVVSLREKGILASILIGSVALAPFILAFHGGAHGPFQDVAQFVWEPSVEDIQTAHACQDPNTTQCLSLMRLSQRSGVGFALVNALPILVQLVLAYGLSKGRRFAWLGSIIANLAYLAVIVAHLAGLSRLESGGHLHTVSHVLGALPWLACLLILIWKRDAWDVTSGVQRRFWI